MPALRKRNHQPLWDSFVGKNLIRFLAESQGEDHDAAVYDTGFEFDTSDPAAVQYIAQIAVNKAIPSSRGNMLMFIDGRMKRILLKKSDAPKTVIPKECTRTENQSMSISIKKRTEREQEALRGELVYVPSSRYASVVVDAASYVVSTHCQLSSMYAFPDRFAQGYAPQSVQLRNRVSNKCSSVLMWSLSHIPLLMIIAGILLFAFFILAENSVFGLTPVGSSALDYGVAERTRYIFTCLSLIIYGILVKVFLVKPGLATAVGIVWGILSLAQCNMH